MAAYQFDASGGLTGEPRHRVRRGRTRLIRGQLANGRPRALRLAAHRQSLAVATSAQAREDQAFIDAASELTSNDAALNVAW